MPRPRKWRNVCCMPACSRFGPLDMQEADGHFVHMTVDEFETIRLIDLDGCTQESCADRMGIARTTAQRIYNDARRKLAQALVEGRELRIEGGDFRLLGGPGSACGCHGCQRQRCPRRASRDGEESENQNEGNGGVEHENPCGKGQGTV